VETRRVDPVTCRSFRPEVCRRKACSARPCLPKQHHALTRDLTTLSPMHSVIHQASTLIEAIPQTVYTNLPSHHRTDHTPPPPITHASSPGHASLKHAVMSTANHEKNLVCPYRVISIARCFVSTVHECVMRWREEAVVLLHTAQIVYWAGRRPHIPVDRKQMSLQLTPNTTSWRKTVCYHSLLELLCPCDTHLACMERFKRIARLNM
jgi:hypothetical protein